MTVQTAGNISIEKDNFLHKYDLRSKINRKQANFRVRSDLGNFI